MELAVVISPSLLHHVRMVACKCFNRNHTPASCCQCQSRASRHLFCDKGNRLGIRHAAVGYYTVTEGIRNGVSSFDTKRQVAKRRQRTGAGGGPTYSSSRAPCRYESDVTSVVTARRLWPLLNAFVLHVCRSVVEEMPAPVQVEGEGHWMDFKGGDAKEDLTST